MLEKSVFDSANLMYNMFIQHSDNKGNLTEIGKTLLVGYFSGIPDENKAEVYILLSATIREQNPELFDNFVATAKA